jgi:hypothetical protein
MTPDLAELEGMRAALRENRVPVRFFAEQDFLNGYFKVGPALPSAVLHTCGHAQHCGEATGCRQPQRTFGWRVAGSVAANVGMRSCLLAVVPRCPDSSIRWLPRLPRMQGRWRHLPWSYNGQKRIKWHHPDLWDLANVYVIHYGALRPPCLAERRVGTKVQCRHARRW